MPNERGKTCGFTDRLNWEGRKARRKEEKKDEKK